MKALVDNDILLKAACYGLLTDLMATVPGDEPVAMLGAARFVVPKQIRKKALRGNVPAAEGRFLSFLADNDVLEPNPQEQELAGVFEASAQRLSVNLDTGESQLVAILVLRTVPSLLTGDKRAIVAIERLLDAEAALVAVVGKVKCLEQLVKAALISGDVSTIRNAICAEPEVDKALTICFSCTSRETAPATALEGLESYIADIRASAGRVLAI